MEETFLSQRALNIKEPVFQLVLWNTEVQSAKAVFS